MKERNALALSVMLTGGPNLRPDQEEIVKTGTATFHTNPSST